MGESERSSLPLLIDAGEPIEWLRARVRRAHYNERIAYAHALEAESRERVAIARADQAEALLLEFVRACPDDMLDMMRVRELIPMARALVASK